MAAENVVLTHVTISAVAVAAINWLKASPYFPWITKEKDNLLRAFSALGAAAGGIGIDHAWDPATHTLTFTGLSLAAIAMAAWSWLKQFALQEFMYRATKTPPAPIVQAAPAPQLVAPKV